MGKALVCLSILISEVHGAHRGYRQVLEGLPASLRHLTLDGGTGMRKFHSGFPPTSMQLSRLTRLTRLTLRNFAW